MGFKKDSKKDDAGEDQKIKQVINKQNDYREPITSGRKVEVYSKVQVPYVEREPITIKSTSVLNRNLRVYV